jgi:hypothetical protein
MWRVGFALSIVGVGVFLYVLVTQPRDSPGFLPWCLAGIVTCLVAVWLMRTSRLRLEAQRSGRDASD